MTVGGAIFMAVSWAAILGLCAWCFRTIFKVHATRHLVAPLEIDTEPSSSDSDGRPGSS